jgi:hypothetical protein
MDSDNSCCPLGSLDIQGHQFLLEAEEKNNLKVSPLKGV